MEPPRDLFDGCALQRPESSLLLALRWDWLGRAGSLEIAATTALMPMPRMGMLGGGRVRDRPRLLALVLHLELHGDVSDP